MKVFDTGVIAVDQGDCTLFSDFSEGGPMWAGQGPREVRHAVTFSRPFLAPPAVTCAISLWDFDAGHNLRADIRPANVTEAGFTIVFKTWGDTRIARVHATWQAIGAVGDSEMWELTD
ncbi:H-type lectin domain-containing protein [Pseudoroseicyclus sp. CXY001]|uniref:H-type lectin domain-containing protein n=1 Tax=Pseudoroseicyclus sp. CXY001 TaxID=3242492 RepID=UPI003570C653